MNRDYGKTRQTVFSDKRCDRNTGPRFSQILHTAYCNDLLLNNIRLISSRHIKFCTNKSKGGTNGQSSFFNQEKEEKDCQSTVNRQSIDRETENIAKRTIVSTTSISSPKIHLNSDS